MAFKREKSSKTVTEATRGWRKGSASFSRRHHLSTLTHTDEPHPPLQPPNFFHPMSPGHASKKSLVEICKEHKERGTGDLEGK
ncbi:hypothetical protein F7725_004019 [Dissostichus mawsoni]|uniref:Uncharacterized protein n=1 Tax=Dissostichus mawsoni TaxID=36200 RepID=A0A7J5YD57_DISMA|nr:hypothetical protein F7725_004019 [Dissostichus mawsoni]